MVSPLKDGWGYDYATKKPIDMRKPEEQVRQAYEQGLHEDYGYDCAQMDIEVFIQRGVKIPKRITPRDRADIVIYRTTDLLRRDQNSDIMGIVETKRPNRSDGVRQLMTYMSASSAVWGVWTNRDEVEYVYKDPATGEIKRDYIFNIPRNGETVAEMGRLSKAALPAAHSLKPIFNRILKALYSNTNISRREKLGSEMIRLIFAKIWDERYDLDKLPEFRVGVGEDPEEVKTRIMRLFEQVKQHLVEDGVFDQNEAITLDAKSVAWVVGQLEQYSLHKTDKDVVGDAFEVFAESKLVGEKGEFFTPREVVRTAVELVNPQPEQRICDPACGSGGFLIYALEHVWRLMESSPRYRNSPALNREKQEIAQHCFFGIDKEIDLVKIAKAYMAIAGDGRGGIVQENSLHPASEFKDRARDLFTIGDAFREFDIVFTNPPFGSKIKVLKQEAAHFKLGHSWKCVNGKWRQTGKPKDTDPQILFVERCLDMLKDGGTLAIVLPETMFHAANYKGILHFMLDGNNVRAVVDLPHNTFRPHNNAKTCLLVLQKGRPQQQHIVMAVAEEMGHDHEGRPLYRFDPETQMPTEEIWDDLAVIREELGDPYRSDNRYVFVVEAQDITDDIYVPRYYWPRARKELEHTPGLTPISIEQLVDEGIIEHYSGHGSPPSQYKGRGEIPYIRVADIVNWEMYRNPTTLIPRHVYLKVKGRKGVTLQPGDIVFVRRGSYRIGTVAMASPYDGEVLLTKEFVVFRVVKPDNDHGTDPYYLLYLLSHEFTQHQIAQKVFIDTTLPNIADRWKELLLPMHSELAERKRIAWRIKEVIDAKWKALEQVADLRREFGGITT